MSIPVYIYMHKLSLQYKHIMCGVGVHLSHTEFWYEENVQWNLKNADSHRGNKKIHNYICAHQ